MSLVILPEGGVCIISRFWCCFNPVNASPMMELQRPYLFFLSDCAGDNTTWRKDKQMVDISNSVNRCWCDVLLQSKASRRRISRPKLIWRYWRGPVVDMQCKTLVAMSRSPRLNTSNVRACRCWSREMVGLGV